MNTFLLFAIPSVLVILGMILNNLKLAYDQPESSQEQDPAKRLAVEREAYRKFFDLQRTRFLKRQKRVGQYAWLVLAAFVVSSLWIYFDTLNKTTASNQVTAIQTVSAAEGKEVILSVTRRDGTNVKYLVKSQKAEKSGVSVKEGLPKEPIPSWEVSRLETALSIGDSALPVGISLNISK